MRKLVSVEGTHVWAFDRWGLSIPLYTGDDGLVYVPVRHTCQQLGIATGSQLNRMRDDPDLVPGVVEMPQVTEGGLQKLVCLRWNEAAWWLATIDASKVRRDIREDLDAIREALIAYAGSLLSGKAPIHMLPAPGSTAARGVIALSSRDEYIWTCDHGTRYRVVIVNGDPIITPEESE